jgi:hypothetical protein
MRESRSTRPISSGLVGWLRSTLWLAGFTSKWCLQGEGLRRGRDGREGLWRGCWGAEGDAGIARCLLTAWLAGQSGSARLQSSPSASPTHSGAASSSLPAGRGSVVAPMRARAWRGRLLLAARQKGGGGGQAAGGMVRWAAGGGGRAWAGGLRAAKELNRNRKLTCGLADRVWGPFRLHGCPRLASLFKGWGLVELLR